MVPLTDWPLRVSTFSPSALTVIFTSQPVGKFRLLSTFTVRVTPSVQATCTLWSTSAPFSSVRLREEVCTTP